ncbi:MAG: signal recognition particle-docking protein FtsY [Bacillota bacterium]
MGFFDKLKESLAKTKQNLVEKIDTVISSFHKIDDDLFDELEEALITADVGVVTAGKLIEGLRNRVKKERVSDPAQVRRLLEQLMAEIMGNESPSLNLEDGRLNVILVVGVNGVGKTTTIGKLAGRFRNEGKKVFLAAGDTFRAAAIDQLDVWANRAGAEIIKHQEGSDPAAVVFDAVAAARARRADLLIVDTAGRLHTKSNLMEELKKVRRILEREIPGAPHETLLVLDATTGQNAVNQAALFGEAAGVSGIVLTKLDGTAKGGIILAISDQLKIPVKLVGLGEKIDDMRDFEPGEFVHALFAE